MKGWLFGVPIVLAVAACGDAHLVELADPPGFGDGGVDCTNGPNYEGCPCQEGATRTCYTGPPETRGVGACMDGLQTCTSNGEQNFVFGPCTGETLPSATNGGCVATSGCDGGAQAVRLVAPLSTSRVTTHLPTLKWQGSQAVTVYVCRDRACNSVIQSFPANGTSAKPPAPLPAGVVFWRVGPQSAGACSTSATWEFKVPPIAAAVDTSWGSFMDLNGDGISDLVEIDENDDFSSAQIYGPASIYVYQGSTAGLPSAPTTVATVPDALVPFRQSQLDPIEGSMARTGDVNGDGYADLAALGQIFLGGPAGISTKPAWSFSDPTLPPTIPLPNNPPAPVHYYTSGVDLGDVNGDGYADLVMSVEVLGEFYLGSPNPPLAPPSFVPSREYVFAGGPSGLSNTPASVLDSFAAMTPGCTASLSGKYQAGEIGVGGGPNRELSVADVDGDGFADLVTGLLLPDRALLYLGSPSGLTNSPSQTLLSSDGDTCNAPMPLFPYWIAGGDFDGDGRADMLAGRLAALGENVGKGLLYGGTATGLAATPKVYVAQEDGVPQGNIFFGYEVRSGDVNADGYADVLVDVLPFPSQDSTGAELFLGGSTGLGSLPTAKLVLTDVAQPTISHQTSLNDDFNGDGLDDALVTARAVYASNPTKFAGNSTVYYSTGTGSQLPAMPNWTLVPPATASPACCVQ